MRTGAGAWYGEEGRRCWYLSNCRISPPGPRRKGNLPVREPLERTLNRKLQSPDTPIAASPHIPSQDVRCLPPNAESLLSVLLPATRWSIMVCVNSNIPSQEPSLASHPFSTLPRVLRNIVTEPSQFVFLIPPGEERPTNRLPKIKENPMAAVPPPEVPPPAPSQEGRFDRRNRRQRTGTQRTGADQEAGEVEGRDAYRGGDVAEG